MRYHEFERIMSKPRMGRYLAATGYNTRKAMTLYRLNLRLSQELFTIISCFEVALRNAIDWHYCNRHGSQWIKDSIAKEGIFTAKKCKGTARIIRKVLRKLGTDYTHPKMVAEMDFGFWRFLFASPQYNAAGQSLLKIFSAKPKSTPKLHYDHKYVFRELQKVNNIRNRIAHHEAICFQLGHAVINTGYSRQHYRLILDLFNWLQIDERALLYGLDHVSDTLDRIDHLIQDQQ